MNNKRQRHKTKNPELTAAPVRYLGAPLIRHDVLEMYGRRVAQIIGDAVKGQIIVASIAWHHVSTSELESLHEDEIILGGFNDKGVRDSSPIICNV